MFASLRSSGSARLGSSRIASLAIHCLVLLALCRRITPVFVQPLPLAHGNRGASTILYFSPPGQQDVLVAKQSKPKPAKLYVPVARKPQFNAEVTSQKDAPPQNSSEVSSATSGSPLSSDLNGSASGADVRPAIEVTLVDPPVTRADIPPGVEGDVIIEISIDEQGNVIGTKLIRGLTPVIDEKCLVTASKLHYRPATSDGVPIPSKSQHYWHYPHA